MANTFLNIIAVFTLTAVIKPLELDRIETAAPKFNLESNLFTSLPKAIDSLFLWKTAAFLLQLGHSFYSNSCDVTRDNGFYWSFDYRKPFQKLLHSRQFRSVNCGNSYGDNGFNFRQCRFPFFTRL
jgi:hypothetical protein